VDIIDAYLVEGLSVPEIGERFSLSEGDVRGRLRADGIRIAHNAAVGLVTKAAQSLGYKAFDGFVRAQSHRSLTDQARHLGVSRSALSRTYDAYHRFLATAKG